MADDNYAAWYAQKLWTMLPVIYRTLDGPNAATAGPLQEFLTRIGSQAAVIRRSIDRLWENQSIETCDDWVIPYIGDLLATRIVSCLPARAQRLDVAKTIYYRRRAGTLGLIEELATDIAGHDARAVEFFRRLGRTRHAFDPPVGLVANLSIYKTSKALLEDTPPGVVIEGLRGAYSRTPAGGFADLRNAYAAGNAGTAFDEFAYTADLRAGAQTTGWYNISHLGLFIWWPYAYPVAAGTPVQRTGCPKNFTFDPTGRNIQLFAPSQRAKEDFADNWVAPNEWQLSVPIRNSLWQLLPEALYPDAFNITLGDGAAPPVQPHTGFIIDPQSGEFWFTGAAPAADVAVSYYFGFSSTVGAGFDPGFLPALACPAARQHIVAGAAIDPMLAALDADATLLFADSTTFAGPSADPGTNATPPQNLALSASPGRRPVLRWTAPGSAWTLTGNNGALILNGLWLQGADLVLAGSWDSVTIQLCTIDPGTADTANPGQPLTAVDGVALAPSRIFIDGEVATLTVQNSICGPIIARGGAFTRLLVNGSIIQAPGVTQPVPPDPAHGVSPPPVFPPHVAILAKAGAVALSQSTILGQLRVHEISASECILDDIATVDDSQDGCVRFSTIAAGSNLHAPFRCAVTTPVSDIFESRRFGSPLYARLAAGADFAILPNTGKPAPSVLYGASNGAQPGAFCAELQALTQRGLAAKLQEYAPASLIPVWVDADAKMPGEKVTP